MIQGNIYMPIRLSDSSIKLELPRKKDFWRKRKFWRASINAQKGGGISHYCRTLTEKKQRKEKDKRGNIGERKKRSAPKVYTIEAETRAYGVCMIYKPISNRPRAKLHVPMYCPGGNLVDIESILGQQLGHSKPVFLYRATALISPVNDRDGQSRFLPKQSKVPPSPIPSPGGCFCPPLFAMANNSFQLMPSSTPGILHPAGPTGYNPPQDESTAHYRLNHLALRITDRARSLHFYGDLLGMRVIFTFNGGPFTI